MKTVLITGAEGFIGKNLCAALANVEGIKTHKVVSSTPPNDLAQWVQESDVIFHLAGANRPENPADFYSVNVDFTKELLRLSSLDQKKAFVFSSTTHVSKESEYGKSKLAAETLVKNAHEQGEIDGYIYRLPGVFGKWSKPSYNTVVATFCFNAARGLPLEIRDSEFEIFLCYIDDVVQLFIKHILLRKEEELFFEVSPTYGITLGALAKIVLSFPESRQNLLSPRIDDPLIKKLYSTYLTFLPPGNLSYPLTLRSDNRGTLYEWIKSPKFGQIFISTTKPGVTRGNHHHTLKTEKFLVIHGTALIQLRPINSENINEYIVHGSQPEVVDIPPGMTHNITNIGETDLTTLFWANEIFDPKNPDTQFLPV